MEGGIDGDRADSGEEQRVTVGIGLRHILRGDRAIGARLVLHRDRLAERVMHLVGDQPRGDVGRAARREGNDQPHRAGGIILSVRLSAEKNRERRERGHT